MKKQSILCTAILFCLSSIAQNKTYFVSHTGNDNNDGLSSTTAWSTLSRVNSIDLQPGDKVLFEGGQNFTGGIELNASDAGTATNPVTISSYGSGAATLKAVSSAGINATNASAIRISNLIFQGDGSNYDGIDIFINQTTANIESISIDSVEVSGFGGRGALIGAYSTDKGINHLKIEHSSFHDNTIAGLETFGDWPAFSNKDFTIRYCKFYNNYGSLTATSKATGSGVVVSGVDGGVIEYCEAYNNGANNRSTGGGPVGIWAYDAKNIIIQYCESHHNKAGLTKDGGGFDLDGGSEYCTVQYCYSHDNEGYGMALVEYGSPNEFTGNIIRYNISQNDARKNSYGAICLYAEDASHPVKNSEIYNNTIYVDANNLTGGRPCAVSILSQNFSAVNIRNNIFYVNSGVDMINSYFAFSTSQVYFANNNYYSAAASYDFLWNGTHYTSLDDWRTAATGQETNSGVSLGITENPLLMDAGTGSTINPADGGNFNALFGYSLNSFSPLVDKAIKIDNTGSHDFFGNALPTTSNYDIGAAEAMPASVLPLSITQFSAKANENGILLQWQTANEEYLDKYEVQKSLNGKDFKTIGYVPAARVRNYSFTDEDSKTKAVFYRLRYVYPNDKYGTSKIIQISQSVVTNCYAFYKEGEGVQLQLNCDNEEKIVIALYSSSGSLLYRSPYNLKEGNHVITVKEADNWKRGVYFVQIIGNNISSTKFIKQ